jgi:catechol 2,3-dioxygenase-like lactoylglutathione lyase family enzyme
MYFRMEQSISRRSLLLSLPALMMAARRPAQTIAPSISARGINHVTLAVSDMKRSLDFYQGLFGLPVLNRQGTTAISLRIGAGPQHLGLSSAGQNPPNMNHICLGVENFDVDRIIRILNQHGITNDANPAPMRFRLRTRGPEAGGAAEGTPELHFGDPDGIVIQLQDASYCGGAGFRGNVCQAPEASPKRGLLAVRDWSHCTNMVSDAERSNKFYQQLFGFRIQAYQGPSAPVLNAGQGVQFLMFAAAAGANTPPRPVGIHHLCLGMDNFNPDQVIRALESYGIKPRASAQGAPGPLVHYISLRMENRGGAREGTPELYFTDPDGLLIQLQDVKYCGGGGFLGDVCRSVD